MRVVRLIWVGLVFRVKELTRSGLLVFTSIIEPLIFATLTYYLFSAGSKPETVIYSALGAGMMGIWSSTLFASGERSRGSAGRERSSCSSPHRRPSCS
jgi:ABC-2 type transport system permease protein